MRASAGTLVDGDGGERRVVIEEHDLLVGGTRDSQDALAESFQRRLGCIRTHTLLQVDELFDCLKTILIKDKRNRLYMHADIG